MSYNYAVVWFEREHMYLEGHPRKLLSYCKMFYKLEKAKEFQKTYCKPYPKIYELLKN